jgi:hypothetical protein
MTRILATPKVVCALAHTGKVVCPGSTWNWLSTSAVHLSVDRRVVGRAFVVRVGRTFRSRLDARRGDERRLHIPGRDD